MSIDVAWFPDFGHMVADIFQLAWISLKLGKLGNFVFRLVKLLKVFNVFKVTKVLKVAKVSKLAKVLDFRKFAKYLRGSKVVIVVNIMVANVLRDHSKIT